MAIARPAGVLALTVGGAVVAAGGLISGCCCHSTCTWECSDAPVAMAPEAVPAKLRVDGPVIARVHAKGVQIYTSEVAKDGSLAWALTAPDATFDGDCNGTHTKGPTWTCTRDGSAVEGHKIENVPAPTPPSSTTTPPAPGAVDWLLLEAKSHSGEGRFADVSFIQRLSTTGGTPPATAPTRAGEVVRVPYTADYIFFGPGAVRGKSSGSVARAG